MYTCIILCQCFVRVCWDIAAIVTVEFRLESDQEKAMGRNKNFIGSKRIYLHKSTVVSKAQPTSLPPQKYFLNLHSVHVQYFSVVCLYILYFFLKVLAVWEQSIERRKWRDDFGFWSVVRTQLALLLHRRRHREALLAARLCSPHRFTHLRTSCDNLFSGQLTEVNLPIDRISKKIKGFAFLTFMFSEDALKAFHALDGTNFQVLWQIRKISCSTVLFYK